MRAPGSAGTASCTEAETPYGQIYCAEHGEPWPCPAGDDR